MLYKNIDSFKLSVVLPSKDNFSLIKEWFHETSKQEAFAKTKIYLLLSCKLENIDESFSSYLKTFSNVFILSYDSSFTMEDKIKAISNKIDTAYVYLCGDGVIPNLDSAYNIIYQNEFDITILVNKKMPFYKVYCRNCSRHSLDDKLFYFLTFAGGSIVKKYLFNFNFRPDFKSNFLYPVAILNNLQEKCVIQWVVSDNVYYMNPLKKRSTWMNSNDIVEIRTKNYVKSIFLLSSKYDSLKPSLVRNNDDKKFSFRSLVNYKANGCFDKKAFIEYKDYFKMCGHSYFKIEVISLLPKGCLRFCLKIKDLVKNVCRKKH